MFLSTDTQLELSSAMTISVALPGGRSARLSARVVHVLSADSARSLGLTPGIGVRFERLDREATAFVSELVEWASARDPGPSVARIKAGADLSTVQHEPMLGFLLGYVDGKRHTEALAQELALEGDTIERMLGELRKHGVVELVAPRAAPTQRPEAQQTRGASGSSFESHRPGPSRPLAGMHRSSVRPSRSPAADLAAAAEAARVAAASSARTSQPPAAGTTGRAGPSQPPAAAQRPSRAPAAMQLRNERASAAPSARPARDPKARASEPPLGAAAQILAQAEAAHQAGRATEAMRHLKLLAAMTFDDARIQERANALKQQVFHAAAVDLERRAAHEEKHQQWEKAASTWLCVAEGRPHDSIPWQRAALAQLQTGTELRAAVESAKRAVQLGPNDAAAHRTLAKVYAAANMEASAARELEAARRCDPTGAANAETPTGLLKRLLGRDGND